MGIKDAWKALVGRDKPSGLQAQFIAANTTYQDITTTRYSLRPDQMEMVSRAVSEVFIAAEYNARQLAGIPIRLYTRSGTGKKLDRKRKAWLRNSAHGKAAMYADRQDDIREVEDHPALALLRNPNQPETGIEFLRKHWFMVQIPGNNYWLHDATAGSDPLNLEQLFPQWTKVNVTMESGVVSFSYGRNRAELVTFPREQVIQFKWLPSPTLPYYGVGWLNAIQVECDSLAMATQTAFNRWSNEGRPDWFVKMPEGTTEDQLEQMMEKIRGMRGPLHAGKSQAIAATGAEFTPMQWPNKDIQYLEEKKDLRETIWRAAGIPAQLMQMATTGLTNSGSAQGEARTFYVENTLMPAMGLFTSRLNEDYLPLFGIEPGEMWLAADNPVSDDQTEVQKFVMDAVERAVITPNEGRALVGLEPIDGGDLLRYHGQAIDSIDQQDTAAATVDTGQDQPVEKANKKKALFARRMTAGCEHGLTCGCKQLATDPESPYTPAEGYEDQLEAAMRRFYEGIEASNRGSELQYDQKREKDRLTDLVLLLLLAVYRRGYESGTARLIEGGHPVNLPVFTQEGEAARAFVGQYVPKLAQSVTSTVRDELKAAIQATIDSGQPPEAIPAAMKAKLDQLQSYGPARVAATEVIRSFNAGTLYAWKQSQIVVKVRWKTARDEFVCPFCYQLDGKELPLGEPFYRQGESETISDLTMVFDYSSIDAPPLHPQCRCWPEYVTEDV